MEYIFADFEEEWNFPHFAGISRKYDFPGISRDFINCFLGVEEKSVLQNLAEFKSILLIGNFADGSE